jgi:alpha-D-ribose 1-methylphosphonate 5-triphosphate synthase subunit PhnH
MKAPQESMPNLFLFLACWLCKRRFQGAAANGIAHHCGCQLAKQKAAAFAVWHSPSKNMRFLLSPNAIHHPNRGMPQQLQSAAPAGCQMLLSLPMAPLNGRN